MVSTQTHDVTDCIGQESPQCNVRAVGWGFCLFVFLNKKCPKSSTELELPVVKKMIPFQMVKPSDY